MLTGGRRHDSMNDAHNPVEVLTIGHSTQSFADFLQLLRLAEVTDIVLRDGPWHAGGSHSTAQHCMKMVEYDVNPSSPYSPVFRLRPIPAKSLEIWPKNAISLG